MESPMARLHVTAPSSFCEMLQAVQKDIIIVCRDGHVAAHKLVLYAMVPYLQTLLKETPSADAILLHEFSKVVVESCLRLIYTGNLKLSVSRFVEFEQLILALDFNPNIKWTRIPAAETSTSEDVGQNIFSSPDTTPSSSGVVVVDLEPENQDIRCDSCNMQFSTEDEAKHHSEQVHVTSKVIVCKFCNQKFVSTTRLLPHEKDCQINQQRKQLKSRRGPRELQRLHCTLNVEKSPRKSQEASNQRERPTGSQTSHRTSNDSNRNYVRQGQLNVKIVKYTCHICQRECKSKLSYKNHTKMHGFSKCSQCKRYVRDFSKHRCSFSH